MTNKNNSTDSSSTDSSSTDSSSTDSSSTDSSSTDSSSTDSSSTDSSSTDSSSTDSSSTDSSSTDSNDVSASLIEERRDYTADTLRRVDLSASPVTQFTQWLQDARDQKILDATAMMLSTSDSTGQPHSRVVLLKHFDDEGFTWYTYQESDKARQIKENPKASILFYWCALERQVRIEGSVEKLDPADADTYFYSRPEGSRFSAAASVQSSPVDNREVLEQRVRDLHEQYPDGNVPRPKAWGGYRLRPHRLEFWQGRADRLHDRFIFERSRHESHWSIQRIQP